jgi:arylsulfatase A-like enzyme
MTCLRLRDIQKAISLVHANVSVSGGKRNQLSSHPDTMLERPPLFGVLAAVTQPMPLLARLVLGLTLLSGIAANSVAAERRPNIVMIVSDDHAWTDYSFMGHAQVKTPRLDQLASQSLTFTRGYVPSSLCCPSLVTMITGLYPHQHRITSNDPPLPVGKRGAAANQDPEYLAQRQQMIGFIDDIPTLPRTLASHGYMSLQTGKWWQGHFSRGGFTHGMSLGEPEKGGRHGDAGLEIGRKTMQPIYDFISEAQREQKPFFVWYAPLLPHDPHTPPERLLAKYRDQTPSLQVAKYWAMVEWFDETCGQLLDHLEQEQLAEDTIVVYLADNGWIQNPDAPRFAPRSKQSQYDGGLRTPIMIRWPGKIEPKKSPSLALSIDLAPTLLHAVGLQPTDAMKGIDLLDEQAVAARKTIFGECFTHHAVDIQRPETSLRWRWAINGNFKLIVPHLANEPSSEIELYDLAGDPFEKNNLASQEAPRVAELDRALDSWWQPIKSP